MIKKIFNKHRSNTRSGTRISRKDFLILMAINIVIITIFSLLLQYLFYQEEYVMNQFSIINTIKAILVISFSILSLFMTGIMVGVCKARLNDIGVSKNDIWKIINLVLTLFPGINILYFIILSIIKGQNNDNHHGGYIIKQ